MNASPPPGDDDLHLVPREPPPPRLLETVGPEISTTPVPVMGPAPNVDFPARGRFSFVASLLLVALAFCLGLSYFLEKGRAPAAISAPPSALTPANFHVTAVSLSPPRMAIVNGRQVSEGETFPVPTDAGVINVTVERINDGTLSLLAGGRHFEAPTGSSIAARKTP